MTDDIGAVPAAESRGYGEAVTDEEFETWVKRSQADTEAAIADWDTSVQFDMIRNDDRSVVVDGDVQCGDPNCSCHDRPGAALRVEIIDGDVQCGDPNCSCHDRPGAADRAIADIRQRYDMRWADLQRRILAGEELGQVDRTWVAIQERIRSQVASQGVTCAPDCPQCADLAAIQLRMEGVRSPSALVVEMIPMGTVPEQRQARMRMISDGPIVVDPFAEMLALERRIFVAKRNLEAQGIVVLERTCMPGSAEDLGLILPGRDRDGLEQQIRREFGVR